MTKTRSSLQSPTGCNRTVLSSGVTLVFLVTEYFISPETRDSETPLARATCRDIRSICQDWAVLIHTPNISAQSCFVHSCTRLHISAMIDVLAAHHHGLAASVLASVVLVVLSCLIKLNIQLGTTEPHFKKLVPEPWNRKQIRETYDRLVQNPITTASYASQLPPKLDRRYIVTGGSGLLGGYIVLQLLERGQPPNTIRIVDFQAPHRTDMLTGPATKVEFRKTDISSAESTQAAFRAPWDESVSKLPLTVFHTAAVIIPSARSELVNGFCESVNVHGTENVLVEARKAGADVLISTSSASIAIRPVEMWNKPWRLNDYPRYYSQVLDEADFFQPLRPHRQFFGNYPASKAKAERIVCGANKQELRTGSIRPANGVYGYPTDNLLGGPLTMQIYPEYAWRVHS